jgi:hypothetical protein
MLQIIKSDFFLSLKLTLIIFGTGAFLFLFLLLVMNFFDVKYSYKTMIAKWIRRNKFLALSIFFLLIAFLLWKFLINY